MRVLTMGSDRKFITFNPLRYGENIVKNHEYTRKNLVLRVESTYNQGKKILEEKTLLDNGSKVKTILIEFLDGIRKNIKNITNQDL